jgi:hypothetical protein
MGMAAYEQIRPVPSEYFLDVAIVPAWIATDVGHVNANAFALPHHVEWQPGPQIPAIDISIDTTRRFERLQPVEHFDRTEIAGMPQFIAAGEMRQQAFVQKSMAVGEQADTHSTILRGAGTGRARPCGGGTMGVQTYFGARRLEY